MATIKQTGFVLAQTVISNGAVTGNEWSNPNDLLLTDGDYAESNPNETASDIAIGNFAFPNNDDISGILPADAVITGIEIELIQAYSGSPTSPPITITPYFLDNTDGNDTYYPYVTPQTLSTTPTDYVLGSSTYLFATAFTANQINNAKISLQANGDVFIDAVKLNVFYYIPDPITPIEPIDGECEDCNSPIQAQPFYLALPFLADDRYAYLTSFNYPDGTPIQFEDLGECGGSIKLVFDPAVPKIGTSNFEENASLEEQTPDVVPWEILSNGTVRLDFGLQDESSITRGLQFHTPYAADPNLRSNHDAGSKVIIADSGPFLGQYLQRCQIGTVVSAPISVLKEDVEIVNPATKLNFKGAGVSVVQNGTDDEQADITIPGAGGTTPPQIVSVGSGTSGSTQTNSGTFDLQIAGLNRGAIVQILCQQTVTVTGVTVGGVACTLKVSRTDAPNNLRSEIWACANPPLGPQPVVVSFSAITYWSIGAECVSDIDTAVITGTTQNAGGNSNAPTLALVTTYDNSIIIDALGTAMTPILYTPGAGQALNWAKVANTVVRQGGSSVESAGLQPDNITMSYSITQSTPWVYCAVEVKGITLPITVGPTGATGPTGPSGSTGAAGTGANIFTDQTPDNGTYGLLAGLVNGSNTLFTVSQAAYLSGRLIVYRNGLIQLQGASDDWQETTPGSGTFSFNVAPLTGDIITVQYQTAAGGGSTGPTGPTGPTGSGGAVKIAVDTSEVSLNGSASETNLYTIAIPGGTLGTNNAIRFDFQATDINVNSPSDSTLIRAKYGGTTLATMSILGEIGTVSLNIVGVIVANGATGAQKAFFKLFLTNIQNDDSQFSNNVYYGTASVDSTISQNLVITGQLDSSGDNLVSRAIVVEKIS